MSQPASWRFISNDQLLRDRPVIHSKGLMEDKILEEAATELAFEGHRRGDLARIAGRRNEPSVLAKRMSEKFRAAGDVATAAKVETKLMNPANWFLLFDF